MNVNRLLLCLLMLVCGPAAAQGFAGLGTNAGGFALPEPGYVFQFPKDHGAHADFRVEWWYVTANLTDADGQDFGVQWTLFRTAISPGDRAGWASPQMWMGHAALTTAQKHYSSERLARGGSGQAGVTLHPFDAWIDNWRMRGDPRTDKSSDAVSKMALRASGAGFSYDLDLEASGPIVPQGDRGYSVKSAGGQASEYYSQPFYRVAGKLRIEGREVAVTGLAWLDREWSSQPLAANQTGWDWLSLHFDSGEKLMGFRLRDGGQGYTSATWIAPDGKPTPLRPGDLRLTPLRWTKTAGRRIPTTWRVEAPARGLDIVTNPLNAQAWMPMTIPYWEGPIRFSGSHAGRGYLEMTGYK